MEYNVARGVLNGTTTHKFLLHVGEDVEDTITSRLSPPTMRESLISELTHLAFIVALLSINLIPQKLFQAFQTASTSSHYAISTRKLRLSLRPRSCN